MENGGSTSENLRNTFHDCWIPVEHVLSNAPNQHPLLLESQNVQHNHQFNQMNSCSMPMLYGGRCNWLQSEEANCDGDRFQRDTSRLSFRELLALAESGKTLNSTEFVTDNTSTFCFQLNVSREQFPGFMNSQPQEKYGVSQFPTNSEEDALDTCMAANGGTPVSNRCPFDLNSLPREDVNEDSRNALMYLPVPIILQENKEGDQQNRFDMKYMVEDESDTGYNVENSKTSGVGHLQEVENSSQTNGQRPTTSTSVYLQENHKLVKASAEESPLLKSPQQKPRRKKHRPKVIIEGQANRSPKPNAKKTTNPLKKTNTKPLQHRVQVEESNLKSTPNSVPRVQQRKYTKRKNIDEYRGTEAEIDTQPTCRIIRSSCRRSLNFNMDNEERDESSSCCPSSYCVTESEEEKNNAQGKDELSEKNDTRIPQELGNMPSHEQEAYLRYGQQSSGQMEGKTTDDTFCREEQVPKLQGEESVEPETCIINKTGTIYNKLQAHYKSLQAGLVTFSKNIGGSEGLDLLQTCKRKRTEKMRDLKIASQTGYKPDTQGLRDSSASLITSIMSPRTSRIQYYVVDAPGRSHALDGTHNAEQRLQDIYASDCIPTIKRKRSKCPTRLRELASLLFCKELSVSRCRAAGSVGGKENQNLQSPPACMEALVTYTHPQIQRKKRTKRSTLIKSTEQRMCGNKGPATGRKGLPLALTWNNMFPVDTIIQQLRQLDIKAKSRHTSIQQESHALVPYQGSRTVVPFNSSSEVKKQKLRPKVDLDEETTRVWQLLLENIHNDGIDGNDEEKAKWWEEERRIFNGRANSFIARMHLVQGDRRFSPWKGSVVDSVVGVFLTQNVSDHLSSSAFMSMAAQFPVTVNAGKPESHEIHSEIKLSDVLEYDLQGSHGLTKDISNHSMTEAHHKPKSEEMREISVKSTGHILNGLLQEETANNLECEWPKTLEAAPRKSTDFIEDDGYTEETLSSQATEISSQNSTATPTAQAMEKNGSCFGSHEEITYAAQQDKGSSSDFLEKLMQRTVNVLQVDQLKENRKEIYNENGEFQTARPESNEHSESHLCNQESLATTITLSIQSCVYDDSISGTQTREKHQPEEKMRYLDSLLDKEVRIVDASELSSVPTRSQSRKPVRQKHSSGETPEFADGTRCSRYISLEDKEVSSMERVDSKIEAKSDKRYTNRHRVKAVSRPKEKENWEALRKKVLAEGKQSARRANTDDTVDWDAVRCADVKEIAQTIKARGMNNNLAERIKEFLNRLVREHGSIDLEWLRDIPPDKAKEYLLSFRGLGLKSVECVRLLTLHHLAFPVDTNVGRIAVRLGWVPLQPLPESLQLHLLELYPVLESIQKYLWPRLCKLDQKTLYELHYQMITFGKVFCTKNKPNCNACPMRAECRHFASAFASARLALPGRERKKEVTLTENKKNGHMGNMHFPQLPFTQYDQSNYQLGANFSEPIIEEPPSPEPIVEMSTTSGPTYHTGGFQYYNDNFLSDGTDEIPEIQLNMEEFTQNLQKIVQQNTGLQEGDMSRALVALTSDAASIPVPKLKNVGRLRTEHRVYELPDSHPLLQKMEKREPDDHSPYLLAIWAPGETSNSIEQPQKKCSSQDREKLCTDETCSSCNSIRESNTQTVRGTILIPCRTAMRGSFPLNGTYFQVNEVFSDHESSLSPIDIPRDWLWNLPRRTVYFGTSVPTIFRGLTTEEIQYCFWRGFVCVRGFDRKERTPRPLIARLHFPASKLTKSRKKSEDG